MTALNLDNLQDLFRLGDADPLTMRAILPAHLQKQPRVQNHLFTASEFPSVESRWAEFAVLAEELNNRLYNIYTCINPIRTDFDGSAVNDASIACRRLLLIDLDRRSKEKNPASDRELKLAFDVADDIASWLGHKNISKPVRILSGNGVHLYCRLSDLPNDERSRRSCHNLLKGLAAKFNTTAIHIDTAVFNASRISKVPGTIARKGQESSDRPYRQAVFA